MAANWVNVLVRAFGGGRGGSNFKLPKAAEIVDVSGKSTWVEQVSWTPLNDYVGLIGFKPEKGHWYTVPNQTYDTFLQLIKAGLVPKSGTGTQIWRFGFLRGLGRVRQRSKKAGRFIAGFEQKKSIRKLADAFRRGDKKGQEALGEYIGKFGPQTNGFFTKILSGLTAASKVARLLA